MNETIIKKLLSEFEFINTAKFESEENLLFLRIEVDKRDLTELAVASKKISKFIDVFESQIKDEYYLDIFSPGAEQEIKIVDINKYLNKKMLIRLNSSIKDMSEFQGELIEVETNDVVIK